MSDTVKVLSIWCKTLIETFFHCSKQFLNSSILMPFSASAVFCFNSSTLAKPCSLRTFLIQGNKQTNKSYSGHDWVNKVGGTPGRGGLPVSGQILNTQRSVGRCTLDHPSWNGQTRWKSLQKNSLKLNVASHNNTSWYTDTDGFLEHSPSGEACMDYKDPILPKIILFLCVWGVLLHIYIWEEWS